MANALVVVIASTTIVRQMIRMVSSPIVAVRFYSTPVAVIAQPGRAALRQIDSMSMKAVASGGRM